MRNDEMEKMADLLADSALRELGLPPVDPPDDYAENCDCAGGYPWLEECLNAHIGDETAIDELPGIVTEIDLY
jgi:hypothetical protein